MGNETGIGRTARWRTIRSPRPLPRILSAVARGAPWLPLIGWAAIAGGCARGAGLDAPELAPVSIRQIPDSALQRVRVLLRIDFSSVTIENSRRGELVGVLTQPARLILIQAEGSRWLDEATGFRFEPAGGRLIVLDGVPYRGALEVFLNPLGQPVVVNELPLEEYLRGVVPVELGPVAFPQLEALAAQSVAARTYSLAGRRRFAQLGFDLYADERSQVYRGVTSEHPLSDQAVRETAGAVAIFEDQPIDAFYSSTCGGITADYSDVFLGEPIAYLQGGVPCPDEASRYHRWQVKIAPSAVRESLDAYARVGRLRQLEILSRDATGRVIAMRFGGSAGERTLAGLDSRRALGLRSHFLDSLEVEHDGDGFVTSISIRGRGFGHGVGMCQIGAVALARQGRGFEAILQTYYPGITVARLY